MRLYEFSNLLRDNIWQYIFLLFVIFIIYLIFIKKQIFSIFDPIIFMVLQASGAIATNIYIYLYGYIEFKYFLIFSLSELMFIVGLNITKRKRKVDISISNINTYKLKRDILFFSTSILYIVFQLYFYLKVGIPIISNSREISLIELESNAGISKKILNALVPIIIFLCIDYFTRDKKKNILKKMAFVGMFIFVITTLILSGWKANMLLIIFIYSTYMFFFYKKENSEVLIIKNSNKKLFILTIISLILALIIINIRYIGENSTEGPLYYLVKRIAYSGDIFIYSYTNPNTFYLLNKGSFIANLLAGTFIGKIINIYNPFLITSNLGLQVFGLVTGSNAIAGPNPRHNFIGQVYFGFFGCILYSFIIGMIISFIRNYYFNNLKRNIYSGIMYCVITYYILFAQIDIVSLCMNQIYYFLIVFGVLIISTEIIYKVSFRRY